MINVLRAEGMKLRRSTFALPVLLAPLVAVAIGLLGMHSGTSIGTAAAWTGLFRTISMPYALVFLPLAVCAVAALSCQMEHVAGGFKQIAALPVPRLYVYLAKFLTVMGALLAMQALLVLGIRFDGVLYHPTVGMPWGAVGESALVGWLACIPLAALQLWVATLWESFGAQFAVSAILTVPGLLALHRIHWAMWYPWSQPTLVMFGMAQGSQTVLTIALASVVLLAVGAVHFMRRDVAA